MYLIEKLSRKIAVKTAGILDLDRDRQEIIEYGALNFFHSLLSLMLIILFGVFTGTLLEIVVISFTAALLRQYSGGAHATSPYRCAIVSVTLFGGLSLLAKYGLVWDTPWATAALQVVTLILTLYLIYRYAPADSPNKRISNPEIRLKLKRSSFIFVFFLVLLTGVLWIIYFFLNETNIIRIIMYIHIGMIWQAVSITSAIQSFIKEFDTILLKIKV